MEKAIIKFEGHNVWEDQFSLESVNNTPVEVAIINMFFEN